jgi:hypothetical protein
MPTLLDVFLKHCAHEFSWPRRLASGDCYQVCLLCGEQYGYDWQKMSRTKRLADTLKDASLQPVAPKWIPRARRFAVSIPVDYRSTGEAAFQHGTIANISESGVFLSTQESLPFGSAVDLLFEMPFEISGKKDSIVLCPGTVMRSGRSKTTHNSATFDVAVAISDYAFIKDRTSETAVAQSQRSSTSAQRFRAQCRSRARR